jgi:transcriptional regulator with XRE-family HTH domain
LSVKDHGPFLRRIGKLIRQKRGEESQDALSSRTGVHRVVIGRIERGVSNYEFRSLLNLLDALNISYAELFGVRESLPSPDSTHHKQFQEVLDYAPADVAELLVNNMLAFHRAYVTIHAPPKRAG